MSNVFITIIALLVIAKVQPFPSNYNFFQGTRRLANIPRHGSKDILWASTSDQGQNEMPKVVIFDLDGCLWSPEMYEINFFMGARGSPFSRDPTDTLNLLTEGGESVKLLGDVRDVMQILYTQEEFNNVKIGISSRTDEPEWARELLQKFIIPLNSDEEREVSLAKVFNGPIEIAKDSKVDHFHRICSQTDVRLEEMLFFDNEFGNCQRVASLGVSVVYCPNGVTKDIFDMGMRDFPTNDGSVIGV